MTIRLFEVGGSIRDELMGIDNPPDRDFCAEAPTWGALKRWCEFNMDRVFLVTPEFFTVRGRMPNGDSIDVVLCRKDGPSSDGRHPDHVQAGTLLDDLARRDFTVNAMAREVDVRTLEPIGDIIDPFGGQEDLVTRSLRCVGDTKERMHEDGLRILRAARFIVTKDLGPSEDLRRELNSALPWLWMKDTVSVERVREELQKMFKNNSVSAIRFLSSSCAQTALEVLLGHGSSIWLRPTMEKK
ncbi:MAG: hypothetical protein CBC29_06290 [Methylococcaceae bacterium TMED69]|nr:MAG: hypothetical protein CBC29_06290 [Methylococcaceae bacterium TMED69]|tara:strand:+ start:986 stop:1711 length:726 start_codon:yes stop_codon:yes gene_type:complete